MTLDTTLGVRVEAKTFTDVLRLVLPFASGGLPVYSGVKITATADDQLMLEATNGDERVVTFVSAGILEPGQVIAPAAVLDAFLRSVTGAAVLKHVDDKLVVDCGSSSLELSTIAETEWPLFAAIDTPEIELTPEMWAGVKRVVYAQGGTEDKTANRHCVRFDRDGVVAQNSSRIATFEVPGLVACHNIPGSFITTLCKLIDPKQSVFVRFAERIACFRSASTEWMCRPMVDSYPDWRAIQKRWRDTWTEAGGHTLVVSRSDMLTALKRTSLLPEGSGWKRMQMTRIGDELALESSGPDVGKITDVIACGGTYKGAPITMDIGSFRSMIDNSVEDELSFQVIDAFKPVTLDQPPWLAMDQPRRAPGSAAVQYPTTSKNDPAAT